MAKPTSDEQIFANHLRVFVESLVEERLKSDPRYLRLPEGYSLYSCVPCSDGYKIVLRDIRTSDLVSAVGDNPQEACQNVRSLVEKDFPKTLREVWPIYS